jgi:hypothetical protein
VDTERGPLSGIHDRLRDTIASPTGFLFEKPERAKTVTTGAEGIAGACLMYDDFWKESDSDPVYGAVHRVENRSASNAKYRPGMLIVFVHGIRDDRWGFGALPRRLLQWQDGFEADIFAYEFPAYSWLDASIETAVAGLKHLLEARYKQYQRIVFITHSTGGLVVKSLLGADVRATIDEVAKGRRHYDEINSIALRTLRVIDIAVPHRGGSVVLTRIMKRIYNWVYYPLRLSRVHAFAAKTISAFARRLPIPARPLSRNPDFRFGRNRIVAELDSDSTLGELFPKQRSKFPNPDRKYLTDLEIKYLDGLRQLRERNLPGPLSLEIAGTQDSIVPIEQTFDKTTDTAGETRFIRGVDQKVKEEPAYEKVEQETGQEKQSVFVGAQGAEPAPALTLRGTHGSVRLADKRMQTLIVDVIGKYLQERCLRQGDILYAQTAVAITYRFERENTIGQLIGDAEVHVKEADEKDLRRTVKAPGVHAVDQLNAGRWIMDRIAAPSPGIQTYLLTGDAGVGKSAVIRRICRLLAVAYLESQDPAPLAILLPMQQVKPSKKEEESWLNDFCITRNPEARPWKVISKELVKMINAVVVETAQRQGYGDLTSADLGVIHEDWLNDRLHRLDTVLLIDGIDDFLTNNLQVELDDVSGLFDDIRKEFASNHGLTLILVARSSQVGLSELVPSADNTVEILRLSLEQAERIGSGIGGIIGKIRDERLAELLLTPLILSELGVKISGGEIVADHLRAGSDIMEHALRAIMEKKELDKTINRRGAPIPLDVYLDAAMLIAAGYYRQSFTQRAADEIVLETKQTVHPKLEGHFKDHPNLPPRGLLRACVDVIEERENLMALLQRSCFLPTSRDTFRFMHREWQAYLVARFVAYSVRLGIADDVGVGNRAITKSMFLFAGEELNRISREDHFEVDDALVRLMIRHSVTSGDQFVASNFVGTLGNSLVTLTPPAIRGLIAEAPGMGEIALNVLFSTFGIRVLEDHSTDPSKADLRDEMGSAYKNYLSPDGRFSTKNGISESLCWCLLQAFHDRFHTDSPPVNWTGLGRVHECDALRMVCRKHDGVYTYDEQQRFVQYAYLQIQRILPKRPHNEITVLHYLFILAAAFRNRGHIGELRVELPAILSPNSDTSHFVADYHEVPALRSVFEKILEYCRWACSDAGGRKEPLAVCPELPAVKP